MTPRIQRGEDKIICSLHRRRYTTIQLNIACMTPAFPTSALRPQARAKASQRSTWNHHLHSLTSRSPWTGVIDGAPTAPDATCSCMSTSANARRSTIPTGSGPYGTLEHPPAGPKIADSKGYPVTATPTPVRGNCPVVTHGNLYFKDSRDIQCPCSDFPALS